MGIHIVTKFGIYQGDMGIHLVTNIGIYQGEMGIHLVTNIGTYQSPYIWSLLYLEIKPC